MKTHIIHLEQDDNVVSISEKLSWGKANRILLIYPQFSTLVLQPIDLILIQRAAKKHGVLIGLISPSKEVKRIANELKIPVFKTVAEAQRGLWFESISKQIFINKRTLEEIKLIGMKAKLEDPKRSSKIGIRLSFFSIGVLAVMVIFWVFVPSAVIKLGLRDRDQIISMKVTGSKVINEVNLSGIIPARSITVEIEGDQQQIINSKMEIPDRFANGIIRFTNLTAESFVIPAGTIVTQFDNVGIRFETTKTGELPPEIGKTVDIPIRALFPGAAGNIDANGLDSLVGELGTSLLVTNPEQTSGGTNSVTSLATKTDQRELFKSLETELRNRAIQKGLTLLSPGDIIFTDTIIIEDVLVEEYIPAIGQPGNQLSLHLKLSYSIQYAEYTDLVYLASTALIAGLPEGYEPVEGSIGIKLLSEPKTSIDGTTDLNLMMSQKIIREIDKSTISRLVQGLTSQGAFGILKEEMGEDIEPVIKIQPTWWTRLPIVALRIAIAE